MRIDKKKVMTDCAQVMKEFYLNDLSVEVLVNDDTRVKVVMKRDSNRIFNSEMEIEKEKLRDKKDIAKGLGY